MKPTLKLLSVLLAFVFAVTALGATASAVISPKLTETSVTLGIGDTIQLYVNYAVKSISWSSNNSKVAKVKDGKVTALKKGTAVITAKHGKTALKCKVTVKKSVPKYTFRSEKLFDEHFQKHGSEFGDITKEEYLEMANALIASTSDKVLHKTASDGDSLFFDSENGYFLVISEDGYIRTFFIPSSGINYWNRQ